MNDRSGGRTAGQLSLDELLALNDAEFIDAVYLAVLGRPVDPPGGNFYLSQLRNGVQKMEIVCQISDSFEGRSHEPQVVGLKKACLKFRKRQKSFRAVLRRWFGWSDEDSAGQRQLRILTNELSAMRVQLARQMEASSSRIERSVRSISTGQPSARVPDEDRQEKERTQLVVEGFDWIALPAQTTALMLLRA